MRPGNKWPHRQPLEGKPKSATSVSNVETQPTAAIVARRYHFSDLRSRSGRCADRHV